MSEHYKKLRKCSTKNLCTNYLQSENKTTEQKQIITDMDSTFVLNQLTRVLKIRDKEIL